MAEPRVMTLPNAPYYRDGEQAQTAMGVFMVDGITQTSRLIDFTNGYVIGLAQGDLTWTAIELDGYAPQLVVSPSVPVLFAIGELADTTRGPILLMPGPSYFQVLPTDGAVTGHFRNLDPAPEGYLTLNWVVGA